MPGEAGIDRIVTIGSDVEDSRRNVELAASHPGVVFATVGVHPTSIHEVGSNWLAEIRDLAANHPVVAIGEIGLDFYHDPYDGTSVENWRSRQAEFFNQQLNLAEELHLPVVVHQRNCSDEVLEVIRPFSGRVPAVFHCFIGSIQDAMQLIELDFHVSFTGIATYRSAADVAETAKLVPLERMMVETDTPYLAPVPKRGKPNEPAFARHTAEFIAEQRGMTLEALAEATTKTAERFFGLNR